MKIITIVWLLGDWPSTELNHWWMAFHWVWLLGDWPSAEPYLSMTCLLLSLTPLSCPQTESDSVWWSANSRVRPAVSFPRLSHQHQLFNVNEIQIIKKWFWNINGHWAIAVNKFLTVHEEVHNITVNHSIAFPYLYNVHYSITVQETICKSLTVVKVIFNIRV